MKEKVRSFIDKFHMLRPGDVVAAGVSGGADSVCLLLLLADLRREIGFFLTVVHVEHGIRGEESLRDAAFTERLCRDLDVPFVLCRVDAPRYREETGLSPEEAARELRCECFREACGRIGADRVALAHHAEDGAETLLFRLARGTGVRGMCGIRPVSERVFKERRLTVIRPLLCVERAEIEAWLTERGQSWCTDSTNADEGYARNRIRGRVLPELEEINAQAVLHMQSLSGQMAEICDYLDETAWEAGRGAFVIEDEAAGDAAASAVTISCDKFQAIHPVLQKQLLLRLLGLAAGSKKDITAVHVEQVLRLMTAGDGAGVSLPHRMTARRAGGTVVLRVNPSGLPDGDPAGSSRSALPDTELKIPGVTVMENGLLFSTKILEFTDFSQKVPRKSCTKWFDYDKIKTAVRIRNRRAGDYLQSNADGGHKKLKKFFIDEKVPLCERDGICLLADGAHIMWVIGYRISEAYKVTERTKRVLCVSVTGTGDDEDGRE